MRLKPSCEKGVLPSNYTHGAAGSVLWSIKQGRQDDSLSGTAQNIFATIVVSLNDLFVGVPLGCMLK